ncbi:MAG: 30S ribosomal protein S8 [Planctomycetes bacterium]|nr:30S ribosomal protein S8 [Planctomycetota bacterium]
MMTDPIADLCTRIRNANAIKKTTLSMPASTVKVGVAQILKEEGFIADYAVQPGQPTSTLVITLKFGDEGEAVIRTINRVSKPGRRIYVGSGELPPVLRGMGIRVLSTNKGIVSDRTARAQRLGGEVLCEVF